VHPWLSSWLKLRDHLSDDFLGGPKIVPLNWVINLQKGGTLPFVLLLMVAFHNHTPTAWTYAALHGSYGLIWLLKEMIFPDVGWARKVTIGGAINGFVLVLALYWLAPVLLITHHIEQPSWLLATATVVYAVGVIIMVGADAQKYFVLKRTPGLITDGFFARVRHPNYLGEMMVYAAFALCAGHWVPWVVLAWVWLGLFVPNMLRKEQRMSRHPEWAAYHQRSGFLLPRLIP
jgi:protein-S-isoprenylcysteine O-methyltransferase Ste14